MVFVLEGEETLVFLGRRATFCISQRETHVLLTSVDIRVLLADDHLKRPRKVDPVDRTKADVMLCQNNGVATLVQMFP